MSVAILARLLESIHLVSMLKRARVARFYGDPALRDAEAKRQDGGKALRQWVMSELVSGNVDAAKTATWCHYITEVGGHGVSDLSKKPSQAMKHASEHLKKNGSRGPAARCLAYRGPQLRQAGVQTSDPMCPYVSFIGSSQLYTLSKSSTRK